MAGCLSCGSELFGSPKFCPECGAKLEPRLATRSETRKTVTVMFSDVAGSTVLGEQLDPEKLRRLMARYFAAMQAVIERHGGTVEKFIGDAIMAVFGIPTLHEDDALRAVRAASDMREALATFNAGLQVERGLSIRTRTGITTGEVVAGNAAEERTLVTGDTVNTAARLEQAAAPDEILIGAPTLRLVRDAVTTEPVAPVDAKGKALPLPAYRLLSVNPGAEGHARRLSAPLVGRQRELRLLSQAWERVREERSPHLFTLLGAAGVGKSRLAAEFLTAVASQGQLLRGRCLPYGEGITYWPLAEALKTAAGIADTDGAEAARARLDALLAGEPDAGLLAERLAETIGLASSGAPQEELFWAARRTFEALARRRPVAVVWDDLQWAEPTFLELVEYLADWSRDAPLMMLAIARPELLDVRPGWGGGKLNATTVLLEALDADATAALIAALPGGTTVPSGLRQRISAAAEGNPLFVEEMMGMLVDEGQLVPGDGGWRAAEDLEQALVPPSISALLAARLERLPPGERDVAERGSVVGRSFERGAVTELSPEPERAAVAACLLGLVRKELLRPELEPGLAGDDAFRFRHLLIRDAAYAALPKAERATLHELFAGWLERVAADRLAEYEEIVGHHLAQAYHYRAELGDEDQGMADLGGRAAARLEAAGRRAQTRGDMPAAAALYRSALALPLAAEEGVRMQCHLARALIDAGEWGTAAQEIVAAEDAAHRSGDARWESRAALLRGAFETETQQHPDHRRIEAATRQAIEVFATEGDELGLARAWDLLAHNAFIRGDLELAGEAWRSADDHARRAHDPAEETRIQTLLPATSIYGWRTTSEALRYCEELAAPGASPMLRARLTAIMAELHAARGERDRAIELRTESRSLLDDLAVPWLSAETRISYAEVDMLRGDWSAAEQELLNGYEVASQHGLRHAGALMGYLVETLLQQGRTADAKAWLIQAAQVPGSADPGAAPRLSILRAWVAADVGDESEARAALRLVGDEYLELVDPLDRADLLSLRADVLRRLGDWPATANDLAAALDIYERKEYFVRAEGTRRILQEVRARADAVGN